MARMTKKQKMLEIKEAFAELDNDDIEGAEAIIEYCWEIGLDPSIISNELHNFMSMSKFIALSKEIQELINDPPEQKSFKKKESLEERWNKMTLKDKMPHIKELCDEALLLGTMKHNPEDIRTFGIENINDMVCRKFKDLESSAKTEIRRALAEVCKNKNEILPYNILDYVHQNWVAYVAEQVEVDTFARQDEKHWTLFKTHYEPVEQPFPSMKAVLDRMSDGDAFAAFIWGIFSRRYKGRQIVWIYGKHGEEGKSYLSKFIGEKLFGKGNAYKVIANSHMKDAARFLGSSLLGAYYLVYPDANNEKVLMSEFFKSLSGGGRDDMVAEEKFKQAYTATIQARCVICSNREPYLLDANWLLSRLILLDIEPLDGPKNPNIQNIWEGELNGFLHYARECYERLNVDDEHIIVNTTVKQRVESLIKTSDDVFQDIMARHFRIVAGERTKRKDVKSLLTTIEGMSSKDAEETIKKIRSLDGVDFVADPKGYFFENLSIVDGETYDEADGDVGDDLEKI